MVEKRKGTGSRAIHTIYSHVQNTVKGVELAFWYIMKSVCAPCPSNAITEENGSLVKIQNSLGKK